MTTARTPTIETLSLSKLSSKTLLVQKWWFLGGEGEGGFYFLKSVQCRLFFFLKRSYWKMILPHCNTFVRSNTVLHIQRNPNYSCSIFPFLHWPSSHPRLLKCGWTVIMALCLRFVHWQNLSQEHAEHPHEGFGAVKVKFSGLVI